MSRTPSRALGALAAVLLGALVPAPELAAQGRIEVGHTVRGELTASAPTLDDGSHYAIWTFVGRAGERVRVTLRSEDFDAYLAVGRLKDGACVADCETDDDSGGGTDARLSYTLPGDGTFSIRVNTLREGETGAYTLSLDSVAVPPPPTAQPVQAGQTVHGTLGEGDAEAEDGSYYDLYRVSARAGDTLTITMRSGDFDAYLVVGRMVDGELETMESDDDSGGGTDAQVRFVVPADGDYHIHANSLGAGETGAYTLEIVSGR